MVGDAQGAPAEPKGERARRLVFDAMRDLTAVAERRNVELRQQAVRDGIEVTPSMLMRVPPTQVQVLEHIRAHDPDGKGLSLRDINKFRREYLAGGATAGADEYEEQPAPTALGAELEKRLAAFDRLRAELPILVERRAAELQTYNVNHINSLGGRLNDALARIAQQDADAEESGEILGRLEDQAAAQAEQLAAATQEKAALEQRVAALEGERDATTARATAAEARVSELEQAQRDAAEAAQRREAEHARVLEDLRAQLNGEHAAALAERDHQLEAARAAERDAVTRRDEVVDALARVRDGVEAEVADLRARAQRAERMLEEALAQRGAPTLSPEAAQGLADLASEPGLAAMGGPGNGGANGGNGTDAPGGEDIPVVLPAAARGGRSQSGRRNARS